jgi:hypothetical protein
VQVVVLPPPCPKFGPCPGQAARRPLAAALAFRQPGGSIDQLTRFLLVGMQQSVGLDEVVSSRGEAPFGGERPQVSRLSSAARCASLATTLAWVAARLASLAVATALNRASRAVKAKTDAGKDALTSSR